jgi:hypothetical protein
MCQRFILQLTLATLIYPSFGIRLLSQTHETPFQPQNFPALVDITETSGIDFRYSHGGSGERYYVETVGAGVALIDFDNDGLLDVYFLNGARLPGYAGRKPLKNALYRNDGEQDFSDTL